MMLSIRSSSLLPAANIYTSFGIAKKTKASRTSNSQMCIHSKYGKMSREMEGASSLQFSHISRTNHPVTFYGLRRSVISASSILPPLRHLIERKDFGKQTYISVSSFTQQTKSTSSCSVCVPSSEKSLSMRMQMILCSAPFPAATPKNISLSSVHFCHISKSCQVRRRICIRICDAALSKRFSSTTDIQIWLTQRQNPKSLRNPLMPIIRRNQRTPWTHSSKKFMQVHIAG